LSSSFSSNARAMHSTWICRLSHMRQPTNCEFLS
jgi:hypothetical protein